MIQDFIERYYPNYTSCDTIARLDDLHKIMNNEEQDGDCSYNLLQSEYAGERNNPMIGAEYNRLMQQVLTASIEAMLEERGKFIVQPVLVQDEEVQLTSEEEANKYGLYLRKNGGEAQWIADYDERRTAESVCDFLQVETCIPLHKTVYTVTVDSDSGLSTTVWDNEFEQAQKAVEIMQMYDNAMVDSMVNASMAEDQYIVAAKQCLNEMIEQGVLGVDSIVLDNDIICTV